MAAASVGLLACLPDRSTLVNHHQVSAESCYGTGMTTTEAPPETGRIGALPGWVAIGVAVSVPFGALTNATGIWILGGLVFGAAAGIAHRGKSLR